jgi:K+-transporting ATPase A subunit
MLHGGRTNGMLRTLLVSLVALLALPASALAATGDVHKDRTTEIMLGIIFVLMLAMVLIGVLEGRKH